MIHMYCDVARVLSVYGVGRQQQFGNLGNNYSVVHALAHDEHQVTRRRSACQGCTEGLACCEGLIIIMHDMHRSIEIRGSPITPTHPMEDSQRLQCKNTEASVGSRFAAS